MGEFSRTPNIDGNGGRDHWARSWSVVVGGGGFKRGVVVGETSSDGKEVVGGALHVAGRDGERPQVARDLAGDDLHGQERPADEDRQLGQGDQGTVRLAARGRYTFETATAAATCGGVDAAPGGGRWQSISTSSNGPQPDAADLYEVARWGNGYFPSGPTATCLVHPDKNPTKSIDLKAAG